MKNYNWNYPTTIWFGEGRIKELHLACKNLKIKKPLLVTDSELSKTKIVQDVLNEDNLKSLSIILETLFKSYGT